MSGSQYDVGATTVTRVVSIKKKYFFRQSNSIPDVNFLQSDWLDVS